jgi:ABC-type Fe3+-hydroxamate transport system substrate-binding protein
MKRKLLFAVMVLVTAFAISCGNAEEKKTESAPATDQAPAATEDTSKVNDTRGGGVTTPKKDTSAN